MDYAALIDHTILAPQATKEQVKQLCGEAMEYGFHSVCVNSSFVYYCAQLLKDHIPFRRRFWRKRSAR